MFPTLIPQEVQYIKKKINDIIWFTAITILHNVVKSRGLLLLPSFNGLVSINQVKTFA